jgi:CheY-like chemotaxis protein
MLSDRGHDTELAMNGAVALARMSARRPDLVLLDVMMPVLDGPEMLRRMRQDPELRDVPVILMTALPSAIPSDINPLVQTVLIKPFTPQALLNGVDRLLSRE